MLRKLLFTVGCLCVGLGLLAQSVTIIPEPQQLNVRNGHLQSADFRLQTRLSLPESEMEMLQSMLPFGSGTRQAVVRIDSLLPSAIPSSKTGAYTLAVGDSGIAVGIKDESSLFYALKTLEQVIERTAAGDIRIPHLSILDYPDVNYRGTVEGFYGTPWSYKDRLDQLKFYGDLKMNMYIYGPKDDPYHSSPDWRKPYPAANAAQIASLAAAAKKEKVHFVWAIHPGKDIQWNNADSVAVLRKFENMYQLGVRAFAVFFDDISGDGTNAEKQAGLLNYLQREFAGPKGDVMPLILCPTEYNRSWSDPKPGTYLDILGEKLDPEILVMWTGNRVISDIDMPTLNWINPRIQRKALIWWNYPVSDYVRDHLLMGPVYGNAPDIANDVSGFVANPMEHATASKTGIFGVAQYTWNMRAYDSSKVFLQAMNVLMPHAPEAFRLFSENNSDLGPNGHGYRRTESVAIQPFIEKVEQGMAGGQMDAAAFETVRVYFESIKNAPGQLRDTGTRAAPGVAAMLRETDPWLQQFELLGLTGTEAMNAYDSLEQHNAVVRWNGYLNLADRFADMKALDRTLNQNPYQPGVKTGSLVLEPFVQKLHKKMGEEITHTATDVAGTDKNERVFSNIPQLQQQPVTVTAKQVTLSPALEVIRLEPGNYVGLQWLNNREPVNLRFNFDTDSLANWGRFERSANGSQWQTVEWNGRGKRATINMGDSTARFVRFINHSGSPQNIYLREFVVNTKPSASSTDIKLVQDGDPSTFIRIAPGNTVTVPKKKGMRALLLMDNRGSSATVTNHRKKKPVVSGSNYVELNSGPLRRTGSLNIANTGNKEIRLYELLQEK